MKRFNSFQIKCFMAFLMVFDHIPHIPGLVPSALEGAFHVLTRCVAVWFAYLATTPACFSGPDSWRWGT